MPTEPVMPVESTRPARRASGRWVVHGTLALLGGGVVVALALQDRFREGLAVAGILAVYGFALALLSRRGSEAAALLSGDARDERQQSVLLRANAVTGMVVVTVLVGGFILSLVTDSPDQDLYSSLCAIAGITYVAATAWLSRRG